MVIRADDLKWYYSTGSQSGGNTSTGSTQAEFAARSLGGKRGSEITADDDTMLSVLFPELTGIQTRDGHVDFRCVYLQNDDRAPDTPNTFGSGLDYRRPIVYITPTDNPSPDPGDNPNTDAIRVWKDPAPVAADPALATASPVRVISSPGGWGRAEPDSSAPTGSGVDFSAIIDAGFTLPATGAGVGNFSNPTSETSSVALDTRTANPRIPSGEAVAIWFMRITPPNTPANALRRLTVTVQGDSPGDAT